MDNRDKHLRSRHRAFTLLELLVVISIIAILVGLAFFGFKALNNSANTKRTKMMLANAASMLAEYDTATGLRKQPSRMWVNPASPTQYTAAGFDIWRDTDPVTVGNQSLTVIKSVDAEEADADPNYLDRVGMAVRNTSVVMAEMSTVAGVKNMLSQLPGNAMMVCGKPLGGGNYTVHEAQPVIMDGWGNPIIFVPANGLANVVIGEKGPLTSAKPFVVTNTKAYDQSTLTATAVFPNARPFFASAGPDGVFGFVDVDGDGAYTPNTDIPGGNDNIYSFEN